MATTALAVMENFSLATPYDGMDEETIEALKEQMADLDEDSGILCRHIKLTSGKNPEFEVETDDENSPDFRKEITGVILFTHKTNVRWVGEFGADDALPTPACVSKDGVTGVDGQGMVSECRLCPYNQFGSDVKTGKGKECRNMRRIYMMLDGDANIYMLSVPPTSIKDVNKQLQRIMTSGKPVTSVVVTLSLTKITAGSLTYGKIAIKTTGLLTPAQAKTALVMRKSIKAQYDATEVSVTSYTAAANAEGGGAAVADAEFTDVSSEEELPF